MGGVDRAGRPDRGAEAEPKRLPRVRLYAVGLPSEHGSWGLALEPLALGLLVAPSVTGLVLALGLLAAFLVHHPLQVAWRDRRKGKSYPRTRVAEGLVLLFSAIALGCWTWVLLRLGILPFLPLVLAAPLGLVFVGAAARGEMRSAVAEAAAALTLAAGAAAVARAGGAPPALSWSLWALAVARSVPAVLYVRTRLRLERGENPPRLAALGSQALGVLLAALLVLETPVPPLAVVAVGLLLLRALWGLSSWRRPSRPWKVGLAEVGWGALFVLLVALSGCAPVERVEGTGTVPTGGTGAWRSVRPPWCSTSPILPPVSDHYGLLVELEIANRSGISVGEPER